MRNMHRVRVIRSDAGQECVMRGRPMWRILKLRFVALWRWWYNDNAVATVLGSCSKTAPKLCPFSRKESTTWPTD